MSALVHDAVKGFRSHGQEKRGLMSRCRQKERVEWGIPRALAAPTRPMGYPAGVWCTIDVLPNHQAPLNRALGRCVGRKTPPRAGSLVSRARGRARARAALLLPLAPLPLAAADAAAVARFFIFPALTRSDTQFPPRFPTSTTQRQQTGGRRQRRRQARRRRRRRRAARALAARARRARQRVRRARRADADQLLLRRRRRALQEHALAAQQEAQPARGTRAWRARAQHLFCFGGGGWPAGGRSFVCRFICAEETNATNQHNRPTHQQTNTPTNQQTNTPTHQQTNTPSTSNTVKTSTSPSNINRHTAINRPRPATASRS